MTFATGCVPTPVVKGFSLAASAGSLIQSTRALSAVERDSIDCEALPKFDWSVKVLAASEKPELDKMYVYRRLMESECGAEHDY